MREAERTAQSCTPGTLSTLRGCVLTADCTPVRLLILCALQNVSHQKVRLFGEAFAKVQEATGISDIDELVKAFATAEVRRHRVVPLH